jgi:molybdopterin-guanine dinucleotide biosynthesis protein A
VRESTVGVILAGGGATRFGGAPKGLETIGDQRIIDRVASVLRLVTDELLLIANAPNATTWLPGVRTERDVRTGAGALGGLHAALTHARADIVLVAWDMPFVSAALLGEMRDLGEREGADAVLPASDSSGRGVEPLCGWYSARCLGAIEASLDRDDLRVVGFHRDVRVKTLSAERVQAFGDPRRLFSNVNTPADLEAARG